MLTGCPIRKSAGQGIFAPNRGLSQLITSFIASMSQGIRHAPLFTFLVVAINMAAHTFSCIPTNKNVRKTSLLSFILQSRVSICQRSLGVNPAASAEPGIERLQASILTSVENNGFEPLTPCLQSRCSSQLS